MDEHARAGQQQGKKPLPLDRRIGVPRSGAFLRAQCPADGISLTHDGRYPQHAYRAQADEGGGAPRGSRRAGPRHQRHQAHAPAAAGGGKFTGGKGREGTDFLVSGLEHTHCTGSFRLSARTSCTIITPLDCCYFAFPLARSRFLRRKVCEFFAFLSPRDAAFWDVALVGSFFALFAKFQFPSQ